MKRVKSKQKHPGKEIRNFTLLETVIAVALFGVIASIITSILFTVQQSWIRVKKHTSELESRMKMDQVADLVFRNSIPFYWKDLNGKEKSVFYGQPDELILAYCKSFLIYSI